MRTVYTVRRKSFLLIVALATLLTFMLAACGTHTGAGTGSTPPSAPTTVPGYGTSNGCPSDAVVSTAPAAPNVTVKPSDNATTVNAHVGNLVEVDLPFGYLRFIWDLGFGIWDLRRRLVRRRLSRPPQH